MSGIRNAKSTRRSGRRSIRGLVLLAGLLGGVAALAASGAPAYAASSGTVTAGQVTTISSFYDPSAGQLHVFSATAAGVYETYWSDNGGTKTTGKINNRLRVCGISSFYDPAAGQLHVFTATATGV